MPTVKLMLWPGWFLLLVGGSIFYDRYEAKQETKGKREDTTAELWLLCLILTFVLAGGIVLGRFNGLEWWPSVGVGVGSLVAFFLSMAFAARAAAEESKRSTQFH
jgi:hypothetical protein